MRIQTYRLLNLFESFFVMTFSYLMQFFALFFMIMLKKKNFLLDFGKLYSYCLTVKPFMTFYLNGTIHKKVILIKTRFWQKAPRQDRDIILLNENPPRLIL